MSLQAEGHKHSVCNSIKPKSTKFLEKHKGGKSLQLGIGNHFLKQSMKKERKC